jgi:histidinol-phosphatase
MAHDWLPFLHDLADAAAVISTRYFRSTDLPVERKPDRSLVTAADLEVESAVRELVAKRHPELGVFGEEHGEHAGSSGGRLIVDPIDATANFARGLPIYATLLAIEDEGEIVAGLVSAPALHQRWHAARGQGAFAGDRRLRVSRVAALADAQVFHGSLAGAEAAPGTERILPGLLQGSWRQRGVGDFWQHVLVAEGCGEIAVDPVVKPWDIAPLQVIVEEAGGRATTVTGERSIYGGSLVCTNGLLHATALAAFA